jgi:ABC-type oligopeptide transport system substrate-binding subunit
MTDWEFTPPPSSALSDHAVELEAQRQEIMSQANAQATKLIEEARAAAARVQAQETQKAIAGAEQIMVKAREAAAQDHLRMLAELKREVGRLVIQTTAAVTGKPLVLYLDTTDRGPGDKPRFDWLRRQFGKLNVQLEIRGTDYNRFQEKVRKGNAQIFYWGWNADYPDPENFLFLLHGPQGKVKSQGENASNWVNPEFDRLFCGVHKLPNRLAALLDDIGIWIFSNRNQHYHRRASHG